MVTLSLTMPGGMPVFPFSIPRFVYEEGHWSEMRDVLLIRLMGDNRGLFRASILLVMHKLVIVPPFYIMAERECGICANE